MKKESYGAGVFTISDLLTETECSSYIADSENRMYELATIQSRDGPTLDHEIRFNDRVIFDDKTLAYVLFAKAERFLPKEIDGWLITGFNERFRFYRYSGEHFFGWHMDGSYVRSETEESMLTFMIYLNSNFDAGYTQFAWDKISPKMGMALVFPHRIRHRAVPAERGTKYVLRTDIMYALSQNEQGSGLEK